MTRRKLVWVMFMYVLVWVYVFINWYIWMCIGELEVEFILRILVVYNDAYLYRTYSAAAHLTFPLSYFIQNMY